MSIIDQILSLSRVRCYCVFKLSYQKSSFFNRQMMFRNRFVSFSTFAQLWIKSNNIQNDLKRASFFQSSENFALFQRSVSSSIVFLIISWNSLNSEFRLSHELFNECFFIFECEFCSFVVIEYHSLLLKSFSTHVCE